MDTASHATKMAARKPVPRFSEVAQEHLLDAVEERRHRLFPGQGPNPRGSSAMALWKELAEAVNAWSLTPHSGQQCRKKLYNLL